MPGHFEAGESHYLCGVIHQKVENSIFDIDDKVIMG